MNHHHYEIVINDKDYHATYAKNEDKVMLRVWQSGYEGQIHKLPKIFEKDGFEEWVKENDYLHESMLVFKPEEDAWIDQEWDIPFIAFIEDYDNMVEALVAFIKEFCDYEL